MYEKESPVGRRNSKLTDPKVGLCLSCETGEVERSECAELRVQILYQV